MPQFPTRPEGPSRSRSYTNADLPRFARPKLGITIEPNEEQFPPAEYDQPQQSVEDLLREARGTLDRTGKFQDEINGAVGRSGREDEALLDLQDRDPNAVRSITQRLHRFSAIPALAGLATGLTGVGAVATPFLEGAGAAMAAPDILRRLLVPSRDESRGSAAVEAGLYGLSPAIRGMKNIGRSIAAEKTAATTAENALMANQAERELVDSYAAQELAKGSQRRPPAILRDAHEKAGRIHGEKPISHMTQIAETPYQKYAQSDDMISAGFSPALSDEVSGVTTDALMQRVRSYPRIPPKQPAVRGMMEALSDEQNIRTNPQTGQSWAGDSPSSMEGGGYQPFTNTALSLMGSRPRTRAVGDARQEIAALRSLLRQSIR